ncbi:MAG: AzlC family ABC transporter permease [Pseudomonadota bacterium]
MTPDPDLKASIPPSAGRPPPSAAMTGGPLTPSRAGLRAGFWAAVPVLLAVIPFAVIFGTVATKAGLTTIEAMAFTTIVTAGASQLAALQVLHDGAPVLLAVLTGAVVNLRMAMYSATLAVHWQGVPMLWRVPAAFFLHDQSFALSMARYSHRDEPLATRVGFYFGVGMTTTTVWSIASYVGVVFGQQIPESWGVDFAVPACFIAVLAPMLRGTPNIVAALVAAVAGVALAGLPAGSGLTIAAALGIVAGLIARRRLVPRQGGQTPGSNAA